MPVVSCWSSLYGAIETPNIDRLANNGVRFTQFYNAGRCWPPRSSILSGYYAPQVCMDPPLPLYRAPDQEHPAHLAMFSLDEDLVRKELTDIVEVCRRHQTPCELILKDISTVCRKPERLAAWERIAMEVVGAR